MRIKFSEYIAIQLVPSDWLMYPPVGSCGALAVEHADVVEAEETALKDIFSPSCPCGSPTR